MRKNDEHHHKNMKNMKNEEKHEKELGQVARKQVGRRGNSEVIEQERENGLLYA